MTLLEHYKAASVSERAEVYLEALFDADLYAHIKDDEAWYAKHQQRLANIEIIGDRPRI